MNKFKDRVSGWAKRLSVPRKSLNGLTPCPYALSGIKSGRVQVVDMTKVDVLIVKGDLRRGWVFMASDPSKAVRVGGRPLPKIAERMTLIQRRTPLKKARKALRASGYYRKWNAEDYRRVVTDSN